MQPDAKQLTAHPMEQLDCNALSAVELMHKMCTRVAWRWNVCALCRTTAGSVLYSYGEANAREDVWMSHGDSVVQLPPGFSVVAKSDQVLRPAFCDALQVL